MGREKIPKCVLSVIQHMDPSVKLCLYYVIENIHNLFRNYDGWLVECTYDATESFVAFPVVSETWNFIHTPVPSVILTMMQH